MKGPLTLGKIPFKNLMAHPARTVILLLLVIVQAACMCSGMAMVSSMWAELARAEERLGADILIYPTAAMSRISAKALLMQGSPVEVWRDRSLLKRMADCEDIERTAFQVYIRDTTGEEPVWIVGFEPEQDFAVSSWTEGGDARIPDGSVIAGCSHLPDAGETVLFGKSWPIAARLERTGSEMDHMVYASMSTLDEMIIAAGEAGITAYASVDPHTDFSVALLRVRDSADLDSVTGWLNTYIRKVRAVRSEETLTQASSGIHRQITLIAFGTLAAWGLLLLALGVTRTVMMKERKKELYTWHALGASRSVVSGVMLKEALYVHGAGAPAGAVIGWAAGCVISSAGPNLSSAVLWMTVTAVLSLATGLISTRIAVGRADASMDAQMLLTV